MNKIYFYDDNNEDHIAVDLEPLKDGFIFSNDFKIFYFHKDTVFHIYYNNGFFIDDAPYAFIVELIPGKGIVFDEENKTIDISVSKKTGLKQFGNLTLLDNDDYDYQEALSCVERYFFSEHGFELYTNIFMGITAGWYAMSEIMRRGEERNKLIKKGLGHKHKYSREHRLSTEKSKIWLMDDIVQYVSDHLIEHKGFHKINCPCWEVRGHYRHYKSGKVVFVPSYRKGKQRDTAQPKEHEYYV